MIIDDIKKANIEALKARDNEKRAVYSIIISRYMELKTSGSNKEINDIDVINLIKKLDKELDEEKDGYLKANRLEQAELITKQKSALTPFLPKQMSEDEIRNVINSLDDKSLPNVMKYFKTNYAGKVDMGLVSKIVRSIN